MDVFLTFWEVARAPQLRQRLHCERMKGMAMRVTVDHLRYPAVAVVASVIEGAPCGNCLAAVR